MSWPRRWPSGVIDIALHYNRSAEEARQTVVNCSRRASERRLFRPIWPMRRDVGRMFDEVLKTFGRLDVLGDCGRDVGAESDSRT